MRYASTYGLECLVLAHQHETFAFQKKRHRRHGIFENLILKKSLKKQEQVFASSMTTNSQGYEASIWTCCNLKDIFHYFFQTSSFPLLLPHN